MHDIPVPPLDPAEGDWLELDDYSDDFDLHYEKTRNRDCWKLERKQYFKESNSPSWNAFHRGDLAEAERLLKDQAQALREAAEEAASRGSVFRRVRITEQPLTPYVQWELRSLRVRSENGGPVRVVPAAAVSRLESEGPLPELVVLGGRVLYQVMYTEESAPRGAIRFTDPASVEQWERFIADLFATGEDITSYVERDVFGNRG
ncbi:DUF6879 family protein [Streptomyces sp. NPDC059474]|uniref:DUF6879 family protein n=1 Tax=Streptomyces sp. NPDC059474 TaxID=3346846 RepID=UPI00368C217B